MKSQHIGLLSGVIAAISALSDQGDAVDVTVHSVVTAFPDGSQVVFTANRDTPETDWYITMSGPGA